MEPELRVMARRATWVAHSCCNMDAAKMQRTSNSSHSRIEEVVQGLRRLMRMGQAAPGTVLAIPELARLPDSMGRDEPEPEAAITVARVLMRAIDASSAPDAARILFGVDPDARALSLTDRRARAAEVVFVTPGSFRVRREPRLLDELARVLLVELAGSSEAERPSGGAHLEIERGSVRTTIPVTAARSPIVIGRAHDCDIELRDDPSVSRRHAALSLVGDAWVIEDLGSANGTETEAGQLTGVERLRDGDVVTIGRTRLRFRTDQDDPARTVGR